MYRGVNQLPKPLEQLAFLLAGLAGLVEPVLFQERPDFSFHNLPEPGDWIVNRIIAAWGNHTVADPELGAQQAVCGNSLVQRRQALFDVTQERGVDPTSLADPIPPWFSQDRLQIDEGEPPPECEVHQSQRAVGHVHGPNDVEVGRNVDTFTRVAGIA